MIEVVATSIAIHASSDRPVHYHVIYDGPSTWATRRLEGWRRGSVTVQLHRRANAWARYGRVSGVPPATLVRISLPDTLIDIQRVIYLDADLVVIADLGELFDAPLDGQPMGAVRDRHVAEQALRPRPRPLASSEPSMREYLAAVGGMTSESEIVDYRQAGVLLMDLPALRATQFAARVEAVIVQHGKVLRYADQCAINIAMKGSIAELDPRWNVFPSVLSAASVAAAVPAFRRYAELQAEAPRILHFAGRKPWDRLDLAASDRWWHYARAAGLGPYFWLRQQRGRQSRRWERLIARLSRRPAPTTVR